MPCYHPLQASFLLRADGKKDIRFSRSKAFEEGRALLGDNNLSLPCGQCMGCRLERSRQWALRCMHESKLYDDNCFVTLTFSDEHLLEQCPGGSLCRKVFQDFMKRLRRKFDDRVVRVFYCGEYGDRLGRPHFHACFFNLDFSDKVKWKKVNDFWYYSSDILSNLWSFGHCSVGSLTFDSAAYVARYCTKKVTGALAEEHYQGRVPEFCGMSLKPGIARGWIDQFGKSDVFPFDECVVNGMKSKPPRYYDKVLESQDPAAFERNRQARVARAQDRAEDNSYRRLLVRERCQEARFKKLIRILEL